MKAEKESQKTSIKDEIISYVQMLVFVVVFVSVVNGVILINAKIPSSSMENTIMVNDRIFGNRLAYRSHDPERFDIIIFKFPDDESKKYIKRERSISTGHLILSLTASARKIRSVPSGPTRCRKAVIL